MIGCLRKSWYKYVLGQRDVTTCFSLWGRIAENEMKRRILPRFKGFFENVVVQKGVLVGHPDFVDYIHRRVIELKFRWRRAPRMKDLTQGNAYACMLGFSEFVIRVSWLQYEPDLKLDYSDLCFPARYDLFKITMLRAENLFQAVKKEDVTMIREYPRFPSECHYCPYDECEKWVGETR